MSDPADNGPAVRGEGPARTLLLPGLGLGLAAGFLAGRWGPAATRPRPEPPLQPMPPAAERRPPAAAPPLGRNLPLGRDLRAGALGAGGLFAAWPAGSHDAEVIEHIEYQYAGMDHQAETSLAGMWLFLATEVLFFGALFMLYLVYRAFYPAGFAAGSERSELWIGTVNTVLLLTSSAAFSWGLGRAKLGDNRALFRLSLATIGLGTAFLGLKGYEWLLDFDKNLFPGPGFAITGPDAGGAQLFWSFYFVATGLHGIHMIIGLVLVGWIAWAAWQARFSPGYHTPVEGVGLYWSFVDMVWLCLYPMIYLVHRSWP